MQRRIQKQTLSLIGAICVLCLSIGLMLFTYSSYAEASQPVIHQIDPNHGDSQGKERVYITGSDFDPGVLVLFGEQVATIESADANQIICMTPPGLGAVNVEVFNINGKKASSEYEYLLQEHIYLDDHHTGSMGDLIQFTLGIQNAPNPVKTFGLDIFFNPDVIEPIQNIDPDNPEVTIVQHTKSELVQDIEFFGVYQIEPGHIRIGGFTLEEHFIDEGGNGSVVTLDFEIRSPFATTQLDISRLVDDMADWLTRPGHLFPCPPEICDGIDNNCDGQIDEGCGTFYWDGDLDGYGDPDNEIRVPYPLYGYILEAGDCNDADPNIHPGATEECDGIDNNCDGTVDEGCVTYYLDSDGDGFGDPEVSILSPFQLADHVLNNADCDDQDPNVNPNAPEICDGIDNNCDGFTDEGCSTYYRDTDGDGFGDPNQSKAFIDPPEDYAANNQDCNDQNPAVNPDAMEICDGIDNNCDGIADIEDTLGCTTFYADQDADGYGVTDDSRCLCQPEDSYTALKPGDCLDEDPNVNPGAPDPCGGEDRNCDGIVACASVTGLVKDPDLPGVNPLNEGVKLDFYGVSPAAEWMAALDDPNDLTFDPSSNFYRYTIEGMDPGIYEVRISNMDPDPNHWKYRPVKKALTLRPGMNERDFSLIPVPEGARPRRIHVTTFTPANDLTLVLKSLSMDQGDVQEKLVQLEKISKTDPNKPFYQDFIVFEDANYRIYGQSRGYRSVKRDVRVDQDTNMALTIDQRALPSLSVNKQDVRDGMMALTFSYRDPFGKPGEWIDANQKSIMNMDVRFFDPNDDNDRDGRPDDLAQIPSGLHITQVDMEKKTDPKDPTKVIGLRYLVDGASRYMKFLEDTVTSDANHYIVFLRIDLSDPNDQPVLGPVFRAFKIPQVLPPASERLIAEVVDSVVGAEILSKGSIPIEGTIQVNGQSKSVKTSLDVSGIDPAYKDEILTGDGRLRKKYSGEFYMLTEPYLNTEYIGMLVDTQLQNVKSNPLCIEEVRKALSSRQ